MKTRAIGLLVCFAAGAFAVVSSAKAQSAPAEKLPVYTYVSEWAVPRAMWADYKKEDDADLDAMKKAMTDAIFGKPGCGQTPSRLANCPPAETPKTENFCISK